MGMTRYQMRDSYDEIVEFSGVESFINLPVKAYSTGTAHG
jgi:ABC-type polysaccharide/polyol phosphate transport system ATPase subunit